MIEERRALQVCVAVGALIPLTAGFAGAVSGGALTGDVLSASADSHWRYLSGLLFAIGIGFWTTIPAIERKTDRFRLLTLIVLTGGLLRVAALRDGEWPSVFMLGGAVMETVVVPLLCVWQTRVAAITAASRP